MWIEKRQTHRPAHLDYVDHVGDQGVGNANPPGICRQRLDRPTRRLGHIGRHADHRHQEKQGKLLDDQPSKTTTVFTIRRQLETRQRPVVEQQQGKRQRHQHRFGHQPEQKKKKHRDIATKRRTFGIAGIPPQGQHPEKGAEHILSFGHPGHRFHVQGVQGEQSRHHGTAPETTGHPCQGRQQQQGIGDVQKKIRQVKSTRIQAEEFIVEQNGQPGQRRPVKRIAGGVGKGPDERVPVESLLHVTVFGDIEWIVEIDKVESPNPAEHRQNRQCQQYGDHGRSLDVSGMNVARHWALLKAPGMICRRFPRALVSFGSMESACRKWNTALSSCPSETKIAPRLLWAATESGSNRSAA